MPKDQLKKVYVLRRILNPMGTMDAIEFLIDKLRSTKTNGEFFSVDEHLAVGTDGVIETRRTGRFIESGLVLIRMSRPDTPGMTRRRAAYSAASTMRRLAAPASRLAAAVGLR